MKPIRAFRSSPESQRGGITIVIALVLIVLMSLAAFSLSRNSIREMASAGSILQGGKASEAADAGLDWFVVWGQKDNRDFAYDSGGSTPNNSLATALHDITTNLDLSTGVPAWWTQLNGHGLLASTDTARQWDMAAAIRSNESQTSSSDLVFNNTAAGVQQATNSGGNPIIQRFDLTVRYLGASATSSQTSTTTTSSAAGGTSVGNKALGDLLFQVQSLGNAAVPIGNGNYLRYQQRREMIVTAPSS